VQERASSQNPRIQQLLSIIEHRTSDGPAANEAAIRSALTDSNPRIRVLGLVAIISRGMAPAISSDTTVRNDWAADRTYLPALKPLVTAAVADSDETVRAQALAALVALDFTPGVRTVISPATEKLFISRFEQDSSAKVRVRVVRALAADGDMNSAAIRATISKGLIAPEAAVRQASLEGLDRLEPLEAVGFLIKNLADDNATVRAESAIKLSRYAKSLTADDVSKVEALRAREKDRGVREMLGKALTAVGR
jgi:HEAT repeat protein